MAESGLRSFSGLLVFCNVEEKKKNKEGKEKKGRYPKTTHVVVAVF